MFQINLKMLDQALSLLLICLLKAFRFFSHLENTGTYTFLFSVSGVGIRECERVTQCKATTQRVSEVVSGVRIREAQPGGEAGEEEAGRLRELSLKLRARLIVVDRDEVL